jgi:hypothetical protein
MPGNRASWTEHFVKADGTQMIDAAQTATDPRFAEVAAQYRVFRDQVDAGQIPPEQLDQILSSLVFESGGRFWMIGANSGAWYASDGQSWIRATGRGAIQASPVAQRWATHSVPAQGAWAWTAPDPNVAPTTALGPWLEVRVIEFRVDGWAHIECTNSWTAWVDGRVLHALDA